MYDSGSSSGRCDDGNGSDSDSINGCDGREGGFNSLDGSGGGGGSVLASVSSSSSPSPRKTLRFSSRVQVPPLSNCVPVRFLFGRKEKTQRQGSVGVRRRCERKEKEKGRM